jgi:RNA polymerase Rpb2, domain 6
MHLQLALSCNIYWKTVKKSTQFSLFFALKTAGFSAFFTRFFSHRASRLPHAIPSRMTIGQLVESITGKACALNGGFGDCTAFNQKGTKVEEYGEMLLNSGFHSQGNELSCRRYPV